MKTSASFRRGRSRALRKFCTILHRSKLQQLLQNKKVGGEDTRIKDGQHRYIAIISDIYSKEVMTQKMLPIVC